MKNSKTELADKKCVPCEGGVAKLSRAESEKYLQELTDWHLKGNAELIYAEYSMKNFVAAVGLINRIADLAEADNHHPDIHLTGYRKLRIELSTHAIGGLSENDFILAAKIDCLPKELKKN
ncbi:MAG: 4a-hydroxytetrahydrobiopterin dehydratase [Candidatus Omnitrophica bacterium]|nr:4a-hydroxytetrahydrobiopterin dehydratase [Candidatus Omnitrophota bacterium]